MVNQMKTLLNHKKITEPIWNLRTNKKKIAEKQKGQHKIAKLNVVIWWCYVLLLLRAFYMPLQWPFMIALK